MRKSQFLSTVAATVLMTAGVAFAQTAAPSRDQAPAQPAPATQQHAPAEKVAPSMKAGEHAAKPGPEHMPGHGEAAQAPAKQAPTTHGGANADVHRNAQKDDEAKDKAGVNGKAEMRGSADSHKADIKNNADVRKNAEGAGRAGHGTTGQGAAAGSAKLSSEQRTKITTIIRERKVEPVHLNVSVRVGTRIPEHVHYYPLPTEVVTIYPEWRGYDYILVGDEIIVIDPGTHEIVAILDA